MTSAQLKKANSTVFPVVAIILGYVVLIISAFILSNGGHGSVGNFMQIGVGVLALVISTVVFLTKRDTLLCGIVMLSSATVAYVITVLTNNNIESFAYAFPILFSSIVFMKVKIVVFGNVVIFLTNVLKLLLRYGSADSAQQQSLILAVLVSVLVGFASIKAVGLLIKNNEENTEAITAAAGRQEESNKKMKLVADSIAKHFEEAMELLDNLENSVETSNFAMSNIAESTESTAEAIQTQAMMCTEIQKKTDVAENETQNMLAASKQTDKNVDEGADMVKE